MCKIVGAFFFLAVTAVLGLPARDELMFDLGDDTAVVESTVREARAAVPEHIEDLLQPGVKDAFLHTYGDKESDEGDVQGYHKKSQDKGSDGYKHFDSYHKKDGDKYGFEKHSEYGQEHKAKAGGKGKSQKYRAAQGDESDAEYKDDDEAETKKAYKVIDGKNGVSAVEDYDGDSGYYADSGDSEGYTNAESENYNEADDDDESAAFTDGSDGESEHYEEGYDGDDGESSPYTADEGDNENYTAAEYDDGESEAYTAEEDDDDY